MRICQKVFQRRMVLEEEEANRAKVVVGLLEREKVQISRVLKLKKQIELRVRTASNCVLLLNNWNRVCFS